MNIKLLIVISNVSIYKTYEIKKKKKVQVTHFFLLKKKKKPYSHILIWRPFFVKGLRPWPKWARPRAGP